MKTCSFFRLWEISWSETGSLVRTRWRPRDSLFCFSHPFLTNVGFFFLTLLLRGIAAEDIMRTTTTTQIAATANTFTGVIVGKVNATKVTVRAAVLHQPPRYLRESHQERPQDLDRCQKSGKSKSCTKRSDLTCHSVVANCVALASSSRMPSNWRPINDGLSGRGFGGGSRGGGCQS